MNSTMLKYYRIAITIPQHLLQKVFDLLRKEARDFTILDEVIIEDEMTSISSMSPIKSASMLPPKPTQQKKIRQSVQTLNSYRRWNESDEKYLRQAIDNGINITEITKTLGRSRSSIAQRIHIIGRSAKSINGSSKRKSWPSDA